MFFKKTFLEYFDLEIWRFLAEILKDDSRNPIQGSGIASYDTGSYIVLAKVLPPHHQIIRRFTLVHQFLSAAGVR